MPVADFGSGPVRTRPWPPGRRLLHLPALTSHAHKRLQGCRLRGRVKPVVGMLGLLFDAAPYQQPATSTSFFPTPDQRPIVQPLAFAAQLQCAPDRKARSIMRRANSGLVANWIAPGTAATRASAHDRRTYIVASNDLGQGSLVSGAIPHANGRMGQKPAIQILRLRPWRTQSIAGRHGERPGRNDQPGRRLAASRSSATTSRYGGRMVNRGQNEISRIDRLNLKSSLAEG